MSTALAINQQRVEMAQWKSPVEVKQRIQAIQQLMEQVLKPDVDFGIIPGTGKKPCLLKPGSEQILAMFEIAVDPVVEDLSTDDCYRYRVTARLSHSPTEKFLGAGVGEASSDETKYKWRRTYSLKEFDETPVDRRRVKYSQYKDGNGMWADKQEMQIRQEPADVANTILKMAKKRAQIDATLTVTGASSMFDQDLDEMVEENKQEDRKPAKKAAKPSSVKCAECGAEGGHLPKCSKRQPAPKPEAVMCGRCGKMNGHEPTCPDFPKPTQAQTVAASESQASLEKAVLLILGIEHLQKKADKEGKRDPFVKLHVVNQANEEFDLFVWHKTPQEFFTEKAIDKNMLCEYSAAKRKDGSPYFSLEHVLELAGVPFVDNKPAQQGNMAAKVEEDEGW